jgi:hypothetical protein
MTKEQERLVAELRNRAAFWQNQTNDPHGIALAVQVALSEVVLAIIDSSVGILQEKQRALVQPGSVLHPGKNHQGTWPSGDSGTCAQKP